MQCFYLIENILKYGGEVFVVGDMQQNIQKSDRCG